MPKNVEPSDPRAREILYHYQAELCRTLGHPRRLQIVELLAGGERPTADLLKALGISKANLSQHLSAMKHVGLVESRHEGREAYHRLAFPEVKKACELVRTVLQRRLRQGSRLAKDLEAPAPEHALD